MTNVDTMARECVKRIMHDWKMHDEVHNAWLMQRAIAAALTAHGAELQAKIAAAEARVKESEGEVEAARRLAWHLVEAAGGEVRISERRLASLAPYDKFTLTTTEDKWNRCTIVRSIAETAPPAPAE